MVGTSSYAIHRNPAYYPNPLTYDPYRWVTDEKRDYAEKCGIEKQRANELANSAFCPFSIGPRGCIGKGVAYLELTVALARTLWLYDLRLAAVGGDLGRGSDGNYACRDIFVAEKEGPVVEFRRREA